MQQPLIFFCSKAMIKSEVLQIAPLEALIISGVFKHASKKAELMQ
jgi:hypothetical protein